MSAEKKEQPIISSNSVNKYDPYSLKAAIDGEIIAVRLPFTYVLSAP